MDGDGFNLYDGGRFMTARYMVDDVGLAMDVAWPDHHRRQQPIAALLGIESRKTRDRLLGAIKSAIHRREPELMLWRAADHILGFMLEIRPAREAGKAVVVASDLDQPVQTLSGELLIDMLGITRAEADVAVALFNGDSLSEIASARNVRLETVRGQVKSLLRKLNLPNQKRLTLLLSRIALSPLLAPPNPPHGGWQPSAASL